MYIYTYINTYMQREIFILSMFSSTVLFPFKHIFGMKMFNTVVPVSIY